MNQKQIGIILLIVGILSAMFVYVVKVREDTYIEAIIEAQGGSCYLDDGTCLHEDRNYTPLIIGTIVALALILLGVYLLIFDRTQKALAQQNVQIAEALKTAKKEEDVKGKFDAFLSGFSAEEQKVLRAVHEQDGILQSTLRYRTGQSKATLSLLLKGLEEKNVISRKASGKTNKVYLRKSY